MPEYEFQLRGREELQVPNGRSEPGMYCMSSNQDDGRVQDIEGLIAECDGEVASRSDEKGGTFFTPVSGPRHLLGFHVKLPYNQLEAFAQRLLSQGYSIQSQRELTADEIRKREEGLEIGRRALEHAVATHRGFFKNP